MCGRKTMVLVPKGPVDFHSDGRNPRFTAKVDSMPHIGHAHMLAMGRGWLIVCEVDAYDPAAGTTSGRILRHIHYGPENRTPRHG